MRKIKWTGKKTYILEITKNYCTTAHGPFNYWAIMAYAAKVIHGNSERRQRLSLTIFNVGAEIVEATLDNHGKCRVAIADADIYDASPPAHRAEIDALCTACYNAAQC